MTAPALRGPGHAKSAPEPPCPSAKSGALIRCSLSHGGRLPVLLHGRYDLVGPLAEVGLLSETLVFHTHSQVEGSSV